MAREEISEHVREILVDQLRVDADDVADEASLIDDLGADELDVIELCIDFERRFGIEIPDEEAELLRTVGDFVDYIHENG